MVGGSRRFGGLRQLATHRLGHRSAGHRPLVPPTRFIVSDARLEVVALAFGFREHQSVKGEPVLLKPATSFRGRICRRLISREGKIVSQHLHGVAGNIIVLLSKALVKEVTITPGLFFIFRLQFYEAALNLVEQL